MGFILAVFAAFFVSLRSTFEKFALKEMDELTVGLGFRFFSFIFILIFIKFLGVETTYDSSQLIWPLIIGGSLNSISTFCILKALKNGELSLIGPLTALTPLFVLVVAPFIIGQFPTYLGLIGVLFSVIGTIYLNYDSHDLKKSLQNLFSKNNGSFYALIAVFAWSIGSSVDKIGVTASNPFVWSMLINLFVVIVFMVYLIFKDMSKINFFKNESLFSFLILAGLFGGLSSVFQNYAISFILVVYVISIKRLSSVFEVLIGHFILKEKHFKQRLFGSIIIIIGSILIVLST